MQNITINWLIYLLLCIIHCLLIVEGTYHAILPSYHVFLSTLSWTKQRHSAQETVMLAPSPHPIKKVNLHVTAFNIKWIISGSIAPVCMFALYVYDIGYSLTAEVIYASQSTGFNALFAHCLSQRCQSNIPPSPPPAVVLVPRAVKHACGELLHQSSNTFTFSSVPPSPPRRTRGQRSWFRSTKPLISDGAAELTSCEEQWADSPISRATADDWLSGEAKWPPPRIMKARRRFDCAAASRATLLRVCVG